MAENANRRINAMGIGEMSKKELRTVVYALIEAIELLAVNAGKLPEVKAIINKD